MNSSKWLVERLNTPRASSKNMCAQNIGYLTIKFRIALAAKIPSILNSYRFIIAERVAKVCVTVAPRNVCPSPQEIGIIQFEFATFAKWSQIYKSDAIGVHRLRATVIHLLKASFLIPTSISVLTVHRSVYENQAQILSYYGKSSQPQSNKYFIQK